MPSSPTIRSDPLSLSLCVYLSMCRVHARAYVVSVGFPMGLGN